MLAQQRHRRRRRAAGDRHTGRCGRQARRHPDPGAPLRRRRGRVHPQPRRHHRPAARLVAAVRALPVRDVVLDGEAMALDRDGRPRPFQETVEPGRTRVDATARAGACVAVLLRSAPPRRHRPARRAGPGALGRARRRGAGRADRGPPHRARPRSRRRRRSRPRWPPVRRAWSSRRRRALRRGPARLGLGQGQAAAHARPGGAGGGVGPRPAPGLAVQPAPGRPRPGDRRVRDAGQDVQGPHRRDAALADRTVQGARASRTTAGWSRCGRSRWWRSPSTGCRRRRAIRAGWRCGSPGCCATATTSAAEDADTIDMVKAIGAPA